MISPTLPLGPVDFAYASKTLFKVGNPSSDTVSRVILGFGPRFAGAGFVDLTAAGLAVITASDLTLGLGPLFAGTAFAAVFDLGAVFAFAVSTQRCQLARHVNRHSDKYIG